MYRRTSSTRVAVVFYTHTRGKTFLSRRRQAISATHVKSSPGGWTLVAHPALIRWLSLALDSRTWATDSREPIAARSPSLIGRIAPSFTRHRRAERSGRASLESSIPSTTPPDSSHQPQSDDSCGCPLPSEASFHDPTLPARVAIHYGTVRQGSDRDQSHSS